jgi:hypothetical protein
MSLLESKPKVQKSKTTIYLVGSLRYPFEGAENLCKTVYKLSKKYTDIFSNGKLSKRIDGIVKNCEGGYVNLNIFRVLGKIEDARLELYKMFIELAEIEDRKYNLETWTSKSKHMKVHGIDMDLF